MTGPFASLGEALVANGYSIVPIPLGAKRPELKDWQQLVVTTENVTRYAKKHPGDGVGILTKYTPAVDIDVLNDDIAEKMESFVRTMVGAAPLRIGKAPKRLMLFRCIRPFSKVTSA